MEKSQETINALVAEKLEEIGQDVKEIKIQTTKTNGRVNSLENYKWMLVGGLAVISMLIVPLFLDSIR